MQPHPKLDAFLDRRRQGLTVPGPPLSAEEALSRRIDHAIATGDALRSREEIDRLLAVCRSGPCEKFTGDNCEKMVRGCSTRLFWFWALTLKPGRFPAQCEKWGTP